MRPFLAVVVAVALGSVGSVIASKAPDALWKLEVRDLKWHDGYGSAAQVPEGVLTLTGVHHNRCNQEQLASVVKNWIVERPHAKIAPVGHARGGGFYVWVKDGESSLNEVLVNEGICPRRTMMIAKLDGLFIARNEYLELLDRLGEPGWWKP